MATYVNDLRLKEIATGDEAGTWGTSTNTNLELIGEALGFGTQDCFSSDADATTTVADGATDPARSMYFKVTSSATLSATRTLTIAPNTISRVMIIENATTGSQSINISQGSGANVTIANGNAKIVYLDGAGSGAAVVDALIDLELADVASATIATADINGGTIDGATIGGASAGAGSFTTLTASDDVNFDSGTLFVDASANEVGIGTTSPQSLLDVSATNPILTLTSTRASNSEGDSLGVVKFFNTDGNNNGPNNAALVEAVAATSSGSDANLLFKTIRGASEGDDATEAMRITYEGKVGINTTSPGGRLSVRGTSGLGISDSHLAFGTNQDAYITTGASGIVVFREHDGSSTNTERVRIDADGNLLVGKTATTLATEGHALTPTFARFTRDSAAPVQFNRTTDDGDVAIFYKDGVEAGVIGTKAQDLIIGTGTTGQRFLDADPSISPVTTNGGTLSDNTIDLGRGTGRWKNLYLGGGLYVGGTGSANFLDDYEEGTWTPVVADATSGGNTASATIDRADYTKIGRQVTVTTRIRNINTTGMTSSNIIYIRGLPFASKSNHITIGSVKPSLITFGTSGTRTDLICQVGPSASWANFVYQGDGVTEGNVDVSDVTSGTGDLTFTITYFTS